MARTSSCTGVKRGVRTVFRCTVEDDCRDNREVPAWMFDGVRCSRMQLSLLPCVSWQALRDLRHLLDDVKARRGPGALEDRPSSFVQILNEQGT